MSDEESPRHPNAHERRDEAYADIWRHIERHGNDNMGPIYKRWVGVVSENTVCRWIADVRAQMGADPSRLKRARKEIADRMEGVIVDRDEEAKANGTEEIARHLPAAPSPSYVAGGGAAALHTLDIALEIQRLYGDALKLREYAVALRNAGTSKETEYIKNPAVFEKQIIRRTALLETTLRAVQEVWDLRTMQAFYETVIDEIGKADPATQKRIMERLAALNSRTGMTMAMRV